MLSVKIHSVKSQGIYLESGMVSFFNGWTSQRMHEILLCLKFEAFVDVIWKSFLACLIIWMLNFFQMKYFDVDTHGAFDSGSVHFISECQGHFKKINISIPLFGLMIKLVFNSLSFRFNSHWKTKSFHRNHLMRYVIFAIVSNFSARSWRTSRRYLCARISSNFKTAQIVVLPPWSNFLWMRNVHWIS